MERVELTAGVKRSEVMLGSPGLRERTWRTEGPANPAGRRTGGVLAAGGILDPSSPPPSPPSETLDRRRQMHRRKGAQQEATVSHGGGSRGLTCGHTSERRWSTVGPERGGLGRRWQKKQERDPLQFGSLQLGH